MNKLVVLFFLMISINLMGAVSDSFPIEKSVTENIGKISHKELKSVISDKSLREVPNLKEFSSRIHGGDGSGGG